MSAKNSVFDILGRYTKILLGTVAIHCLHQYTMASAVTWTTVNSAKIRDRGHLEEVVRTEMQKLDLNCSVRVQWVNQNKGICSKVGHNKYRISIGGDFATVSTIRHELYHIADGHLEYPLEKKWAQNLRYWYWYEPQAIIYAAKGIKL